MSLTLYAPGLSVEVFDNVAPPAPAPTIANFIATPATLPIGGGPVTLDWTTTNADSVKLDGVPAVPPVTVPITETQAFLLTASGPGGGVSATLDVTVAAPDPTLTLPEIRRDGFPYVGSYIPLHAIEGWTHRGRYDRYQILTTLPASGALKIIGTKFFHGDPIAFGGATIALTASKVLGIDQFEAPIALPVVTPPATTNEVTIPVSLAPGWWRIGGALTPSWYVYVPGGPLPAFMPVVRGNWEMLHPGGTFMKVVNGSNVPIDDNYYAADAIVPAVFAPTVVPYDQTRTFEHFTTVPSRSFLVETDIVVLRREDSYRPAVCSTKTRAPEGGAYADRLPGVDGLVTSFNQQSYDYGDVISAETPSIPLRDGPRGSGTIMGAQHLQGTGRLGIYKTYFCDNWRIGQYDRFGAVKTMVGWIDDGVSTHWLDSPRKQKLVGDWSETPDPKSINENWGSLAWWARTLELDLTAPLIGGEPPHKTDPALGIIGPRFYFPDRHHNLIRFAEGNATDRTAPHKVKIFKAAAEPWEVVSCGPDLIAVSETTRVVVYDVITGAEVTSWPVPRPEGLFFQDGAIYYGALATKSIRKRFIGGADTLAFDLNNTQILDGNSRYVKFCLSDGTFGPFGMAAIVTWSPIALGYPVLMKPDGTKVSSSLFPGPSGISGPGRPWRVSSDYQMAASINDGRMQISGVQEGIRVLSKATLSDAPVTQAYIRGRDKYVHLGYRLTNGDAGFGFYGLPLPWDIDPDIDAYLTEHGHVRN
jgi:hypothetical protein